jgi:hypothetical protein
MPQILGSLVSYAFTLQAIIGIYYTTILLLYCRGNLSTPCDIGA